MPEAIADTGPILHLYEIRHLEALAVAGSLLLPELVAKELEERGVGPSLLQDKQLEVRILPLGGSEWAAAREDIGPSHLQAADTQVFALARRGRFHQLVLTDDLALRRLLESRGAPVAGSVGLLIRAYASERIGRDALEAAIDALLYDSSLHLSRAFRSYVKHLLSSLP